MTPTQPRCVWHPFRYRCRCAGSWSARRPPTSWARSEDRELAGTRV